jgi:hypothetical protein
MLDIQVKGRNIYLPWIVRQCIPEIVTIRFVLKRCFYYYLNAVIPAIYPDNFAAGNVKSPTVENPVACSRLPINSSRLFAAHNQ